MLRPQFNILPQGARAGGLLPVIIAVMIYLCALALFAALSLQFGIAAWSTNIDRSFTVQIPSDAVPEEDLGSAVTQALKSLEGITAITALSQEDNTALLETWLGKGNVSEDLPVPALVDIQIAPGSGVTASSLQTALSSFAGAQVDSAGTWLAQLRGPALALIANAYFILTTVLVATVAVVIFGTRAQLAAHRPTIQIVHHMGAEDAVIAKEFQFSFLQLGLMGGAIGTALAIVTLIVLGATLGDSEEGLLSIMRARWWAAFILLPLPLLSAGITMLTARLTVFHALRTVP
ncbi:MAG: hypothetical protein AAF337_09260 [Pseudomonadota bacterium]